MALKTLTEGLMSKTGTPQFCDANLKNIIQSASAQARSDGRTRLESLKLNPPINDRGGYQELLIDLADTRLAAEGISFDSFGFGVTYAQHGSTPGGQLQVQFQPSGGTFTQFQPGTILRCPGTFNRVLFTQGAQSIPSGVARIILLRQPDVDYDELPASPSNQLFNVDSNYSQAEGTTNPPSAATDGLSLAGVTGVRFQIAAVTGQTITAGTIRLWYYNPISALWSQGPVTETLVTGAQAANTADYVVAVGFGRIYCECVNVTSSGGGGITVYPQTVGY